ncbi:histone-lysine N-methyltransferase PRDM9 [Caerostris extrusa]|uniref:Histone-lysine N-methyltransferase PRDM9 n=1 Tax=Caerostris extrusa TaxID=172846 RepID=A0AAV4NW30_CAEEX|nr:histone-lysine N-methyltransferase PRDM9 [Caerostris extrusa]
MLSKFSLDKMNENSDRNKNAKNSFSSDAWTALSEYEKRRYENVQKNFEILKASGITPKMPEFLMSKFKRPQTKRLKTDADLAQSKVLPGESHKGRYPKRNIQRKCYKEEEVPDQDKYLHCDVCNEEYEGVCPVHGPMLLMCDTKVLSVKTTPRRPGNLSLTLSIGFSSIKGAGLGVWTEMPLVAGMVFGPYKGKVVKKGGAGVKESGYAWQVRRETKTSLYVEGVDEGSSNWMRYVNCADSEEWQNVVAFQYKGAIYYRTYKPVLPYTEILVWYGNEYASHLGIDVRQRKNLPLPMRSVRRPLLFPGCSAETQEEEAPSPGTEEGTDAQSAPTPLTTRAVSATTCSHTPERSRMPATSATRDSPERAISVPTSSCTRARRGTSAALAERDSL